MRRRTYVIGILLIFPIGVCSQKDLTANQIKEDYQIFKNILVSGHPGLYEYTPKKVWDSIFTNFENTQIKSIHTDIDFYKAITGIADHVRDGHLLVMRPPMDSIPKLFPLLLKVVKTRFYTDTDDFGIPVGSEIISIDSISTKSLRERFHRYAPADGFTITKKDRQIEREFGILHMYEFGTEDTYDVQYIAPSGETMSKSIKSQSFESIGKRFPMRNSYFAQYHKQKDKVQYANSAIRQKKPFVTFVDSMNTAVLTMNSFALEVDAFSIDLKNIFKKIKQKKSKHLVIDIRNNEGGYPLNAIHAFSYIAQKPFRQRVSQHVITTSLPEKKHSKNLVNGYTYKSFFEKYFKGVEKKGKEWVLQTDENQKYMVPDKKAFTGAVYVLIGGNTFSAGSAFALNCKNANVPLIGEETGGGYHLQIGGYPVLYTLPNSNSKMLVSLVKVVRFVKDKEVERGRGIIPDMEVPLNVEDLIKGKDTPLDYVLKKIKDGF